MAGGLWGRTVPGAHGIATLHAPLGGRLRGRAPGLAQVRGHVRAEGAPLLQRALRARAAPLSARAGRSWPTSRSCLDAWACAGVVWSDGARSAAAGHVLCTMHAACRTVYVVESTHELQCHKVHGTVLLHVGHRPSTSQIDRVDRRSNFPQGHLSYSMPIWARTSVICPHGAAMPPNLKLQ